MDRYVTLLGAEDVQRAANQMTSAAETMSRAAGSIEEALRQFTIRMDDWVARLEALKEAARG